MSAAVLLLLVGGYVSWRIFRNYFLGIFQWMGSRRSSEVSATFVAVISMASLFAYTSFGESLVTNTLTQILLGLAFLLVLALVAIPRAPSSWPETQYSGPSLATFVFELLIFLEAQLVYYFVLPVTIPFP
jgi:sterol desaturase/sphingolipid hydroxylase (fatty acid hydroxylase superfamily)